MTQLTFIVLIGLVLWGCGMDLIPPGPTIFMKGQSVDRYQAHVGEKIDLKVTLPLSSSNVKANDLNRKTYGILYSKSSSNQNNPDCFNLQESIDNPSTRPFCPVMSKQFKSLVPNVEANAAAKAVELTYDASSNQWVGIFQVEALEICSGLDCPSLIVGFYSAPISDSRTILPLARISDDSVWITVIP